MNSICYNFIMKPFNPQDNKCLPSEHLKFLLHNSRPSWHKWSSLHTKQLSPFSSKATQFTTKVTSNYKPYTFNTPTVEEMQSFCTKTCKNWCFSRKEVTASRLSQTLTSHIICIIQSMVFYLSLSVKPCCWRYCWCNCCCCCCCCCQSSHCCRSCWRECCCRSYFTNLHFVLCYSWLCEFVFGKLKP